MEAKGRTASFPSTYVTLKQLQELRLKDRQEEGERLRRQKEEEEKHLRQKDEEERLRKFENEEVEEPGRRCRRIEEKAALWNPRVNPRSNAPIRREWRRNGPGWPISGPSPNPKARIRWREKQPAETDRSMTNERAYGGKNDGKSTDTGVGSGSKKIAPEPSPENPKGGLNGRGRRASRPKRPKRILGGGPERTVEIERQFGDLTTNGWDKKPAAAAEKKPSAGRRGGGFGRTDGQGRWNAAIGGGMVWARKTTTS